MPPVGFEPTIPTSDRPQTYALDRAANMTGTQIQYEEHNVVFRSVFESLRSGIQASLNF
jgi:hypothetical protein